MVSENTGCSSGFRVNQYKHLCAFSLSLISFNSVLIFVYWYKQPIISVKQPIVFSQLDRAKAEFCQKAKRFEEVEAELTTRDLRMLLLMLLVCILEWILRPSLCRTWLKKGRSFPGSFLYLYLADIQTLLSVCNLYFPNSYLFLFCTLRTAFLTLVTVFSWCLAPRHFL